MNKFQMFDAIKLYKTNLQHKQEYGKNHYTKIDNYYGPGKARYFWSKAEWDAYNEEKDRLLEKARADVAKRDAYNKNMEADKALKEEEKNKWKQNTQTNTQTYSQEQDKKEAEAKTKWEQEQKSQKFMNDAFTNYVNDNFVNILATNAATETATNIKKDIRQHNKEVDKKIQDYIYSHPLNPKFNEEFEKVLEETAEYSALKDKFDKAMDKALKTDQWPDYNEFWKDINDRIDKITALHITYNGNNTRKITDDFTKSYGKEINTQMRNEFAKRWNDTVEQANIKKSVDKIHNNILKTQIINSDEAKIVGEMYRDLGNYVNNDENATYQFGTDDWKERHEVYYKKVDELAKQIKDKDTEGKYKDFSVKDISNILKNNAYEISHNIDKFGLNKRDQEIQKSQMLGINSQKTEESVKEAIADDVEWLEKDLKIFVNSKTVWGDSILNGLLYLGNTIPSQGKNNKCADADYRLSQIRSEEIHDPETGLPIKAYDCTFEEDMALINYHRQNEKDMLNSWEYSQNCSACTIAMCLRMKGYDVSANPRGDDLTWSSGDRWNAFKDVTHSGEFNDKTVFYNYINQQPIGSYGDISVDWLSSSGHSMFYRVTDNGKFEIYCTQTNSKIDIDWLLSNSKNWEITRLDDKEVNGWNARNTGWAKYN